MFPFFIPCMIAVTKSLRISVIVGSFLMMVSAAIKCIIGKYRVYNVDNSNASYCIFSGPSVIYPDLDDTLFTVVCHISAALNGVSGIIFCSAPPAVSSAWFPPEERVTATAIGQLLNGLGNGVSFLIARFMVPSSNTSDIPLLRHEITNYLVFLAIPPIIFFLCVLIYFPSGPKTPPSASASEERVALGSSLMTFISSYSAMALVLVVAVSQSVPGAWSAMMVTNLSKLQINGQVLALEKIHHQVHFALW